MPQSTASAGIFPFERLRKLKLSSPNISLIDHGSAVIDGNALHRITLEYGTEGRNPGTRSQTTEATDLYFDPSTHLLVKTASSVWAMSGRAAKFLIVTTYDDYRTVGDTLIPFRFTETMEGQQYATLQLSSVQLNPSITSQYFEF